MVAWVGNDYANIWYGGCVTVTTSTDLGTCYTDTDSTIGYRTRYTKVVAVESAPDDRFFHPPYQWVEALWKVVLPGCPSIKDSWLMEVWPRAPPEANHGRHLRLLTKLRDGYERRKSLSLFVRKSLR